ncbi:MAG: cache domain-containing protein, partial [Rubrivivax sp.]
MAPLLALGLVVLLLNLRSVHAERDRDLDRTAQLTRQLLDLKLRDEARALSLLAVAAPSEVGQTPAAEAFYRQAQAFVSQFGNHVILTHQGQMLMNTRLPLGTDLPPVPLVRGHSAISTALTTGQPAVGDLFDGPISQSPLLAMAVPLDIAGQGDGRVLLATMEAARFQQRLADQALPAGVRVSLMDSTGRRIASHPLLDPADAPAEPEPSYFSKRLE